MNEQANPMPAYKSHKTVRAAKITAFRQNGNPDMPDLVLGDIGCIVSLLADWHQKHKPQVGGYLVQYEDGYQSFSPAKAFEEGYTPVQAAGQLTQSSDSEKTHFLQPKITGYRQLSEAEVALMNEGKALAEQCGAFIAKLRRHPPAGAQGELPALDQRWISIGATDLQTGFMAVIRGIAQPTTF